MALNTIGKTIMRNLFSKPATAMYPIVKNEFYPATRGRIVFDESACNYCTLCAKRCPAQAITVDRTEKTWQINRKRCLVCSFCISVCNKSSLSSAREYTLPMVSEKDIWFYQAEKIAYEEPYEANVTEKAANPEKAAEKAEEAVVAEEAVAAEEAVVAEEAVAGEEVVAEEAVMVEKAADPEKADAEDATAPEDANIESSLKES